MCGFYLPKAARYETLLNLTDADNIRQAVIGAMTAFENENKDAGLEVAEGDIFGKTYEYFPGKFALSEGQKGGEFYTPTSSR